MEGLKMRGKVEITGINTSELKVMPQDELMDLIKESQNGNLEARDLIVEGNLKLVLSVIKRFNNRGENLDDLFQVGCVGLIKAVDNFDITQNVKFSTYAVPMVIECRNPRKDFESYDQKNRIITGNFATFPRQKER